MKTVRFVSAADDEMVESALYYERQLEGLGDRFLDEIERTTNEMAEYPELGHHLGSGVRRRILRGFPYGILYRSEPDEIVITAVMHLRRRPGYWSGRR